MNEIAKPTVDTLDAWAWNNGAVALIEADQHRSADTHLLKLDLDLGGVDIYLKDESTHPTGSLKHRLARSLFLYALCNRKIGKGAPVVEASSGSTAVSEAYFARMIGVPFYAVMPETTSQDKVRAIEHYGGRCHLIKPGISLYEEAAALAQRIGGYYLDQFTFAERATDWRGNNNIAESIFEQMRIERHPLPRWIVMSAGTGGTTATIGRYIHYKRLPTKLLGVDPEHSAFFESFKRGDRGVTCPRPSRIEGIGRPRVEPSFVAEVIDEMVRVPDCNAIGAMRALSCHLGRRVGGSTGTNFFALCWKAASMIRANEMGSLVSLICDAGERYSCSYYAEDWLATQGIDCSETERLIEDFLATGRLDCDLEVA
ncbi:cysteine synthase A [Faunimonas pinastri]|uniref:L-cysteine desulfhydrase Cds1 n=1 Tax=Faunimonas pinastri TaxID=1855383 RepID=A0A1H9C244_9HYPH|nr:pyridoxal-phosphate dependent enzyme [Faunimonas pinastri]SEP94893.1 cysteine synthase A [Faunimonas pinastri]